MYYSFIFLIPSLLTTILVILLAFLLLGSVAFLVFSPFLKNKAIQKNVESVERINSNGGLKVSLTPLSEDFSLVELFSQLRKRKPISIKYGNFWDRSKSFDAFFINLENHYDSIELKSRSVKKSSRRIEMEESYVLYKGKDINGITLKITTRSAKDIKSIDGIANPADFIVHINNDGNVIEDDPNVDMSKEKENAYAAILCIDSILFMYDPAHPIKESIIAKAVENCNVEFFQPAKTIYKEVKWKELRFDANKGYYLQTYQKERHSMGEEFINSSFIFESLEYRGTLIPDILGTDAIDILKSGAENGENIVVSGPFGTLKTTLLSYLSSEFTTIKDVIVVKFTPKSFLESTSSAFMSFMDELSQEAYESSDPDYHKDLVETGNMLITNDQLHESSPKKESRKKKYIFVIDEAQNLFSNSTDKVTIDTFLSFLDGEIKKKWNTSFLMVFKGSFDDLAPDLWRAGRIPIRVKTKGMTNKEALKLGEYLVKNPPKGKEFDMESLKKTMEEKKEKISQADVFLSLKDKKNLGAIHSVIEKYTKK